MNWNWTLARDRLQPFVRLIIMTLAAFGCSTYGADPGARLPVPPASEQQQAERTVKEQHKADFAETSPASRDTLATLLLHQASTINDAPADEFVLLRESRDLASAAGDFRLSMQAIDAMERTFDVDAAEMRLTALTAARKGLPSSRVEGWAFACLRAADQAMAAGNPRVAARAVEQAQAAGTGLPKPLATALKSRAADAREAERLQTASEAAESKLKAEPDDPAANLASGRYLCFVRGEWMTGSAALAKGSDNALAELARADLAVPADPSAKALLADRWWGLGEKNHGLVGRRMKDRAAYWYALAEPDLTGLAKTSAKSRSAGARILPMTLHFVGFVGGAERIDFTHDGARWTHLGAEGPSGITINGITWDIGVNPDLPNSGETAFLSTLVPLGDAQLTKTHCRDIVEIKATSAILSITIKDRPAGGDTYDFEVTF